MGVCLCCLSTRPTGEGIDLPVPLLVKALTPHLRAAELRLGLVDLAVGVEVEATHQLLPRNLGKRRTAPRSLRDGNPVKEQKQGRDASRQGTEVAMTGAGDGHGGLRRKGLEHRNV